MSQDSPDRVEQKTPHPHAAAAREQKKAQAEALGVDAAYIASFVDRFYARIREDSLLGPIFAEKISDWPVHLERMNQFWRSILHNSGEFSGNPMIKHIAISGLEEQHFAHWLTLFYDTLLEEGAGRDAAGLVGARARMIADSLLTGISMQRGGMTGIRAGDNLPYLPEKTGHHAEQGAS
ncbi:MAG: hypothetical protein ACK5NN_15240 [Sphingomonadaceae bacterium]